MKHVLLTGHLLAHFARNRRNATKGMIGIGTKRIEKNNRHSDEVPLSLLKVIEIGGQPAMHFAKLTFSVGAPRIDLVSHDKRQPRPQAVATEETIQRYGSASIDDRL